MQALRSWKGRAGPACRFVTFCREPSHKVLLRLLADSGQFDLCFIDGSHLFEDWFIDGFYCARLLAPAC